MLDIFILKECWPKSRWRPKWPPISINWKYGRCICHKHANWASICVKLVPLSNWQFSKSRKFIFLSAEIKVVFIEAAEYSMDAVWYFSFILKAIEVIHTPLSSKENKLSNIYKHSCSVTLLRLTQKINLLSKYVKFVSFWYGETLIKGTFATS